jgi:hypothetical protein
VTTGVAKAPLLAPTPLETHPHTANRKKKKKKKEEPQ